MAVPLSVAAPLVLVLAAAGQLVALLPLGSDCRAPEAFPGHRGQRLQNLPSYLQVAHLLQSPLMVQLALTAQLKLP